MLYEMYTLHFMLFILNIYFGENYMDNFGDILWQRRYDVEYLNLSKSSLKNYEVKASVVSEDKYPWIARVIHSRSSDKPHMCTAVCISEEIFITAARCISTLHVTYTRVIYANHIIFTKAFVVPSNGTKQAYDDVGFIVVHKRYYMGAWYTIELYKVNRTDNVFRWFGDSSFNDIHKVVGYTLKKGLHRVRSTHSDYLLTELEVFIDVKLCNEIFHNLVGGFTVPCYHSCNLIDYNHDKTRCIYYHGVEGGAIYNTKTNVLLGIAIWGAYYSKYELPVGFTVVNSANFYEDYACALKIKDDARVEVGEGFYQKICNNK